MSLTFRKRRKIRFRTRRPTDADLEVWHIYRLDNREFVGKKSAARRLASSLRLDFPGVEFQVVRT